MVKTTTGKLWMLGGLAIGLMGIAGCHTDMWDQPRLNINDPSPIFADGTSSRPIPAHTVARGHLEADDALYTGYNGTQPVATFPTPVTKAVLLRGQDRFNAFCSPCHGAAGNGKGMIAQRGLILRKPPASYHTDRLRKMPVGHFYDVIRNGYGVMYSYGSRIPDVNDRWAIVAYIRALQLSQGARPQDLGASDRAQLQQVAVPATGGENNGENGAAAGEIGAMPGSGATRAEQLRSFGNVGEQAARPQTRGTTGQSGNAGLPGSTRARPATEQGTHE